MGFSYAPAPATTQVRTGVERATLARRTYGLVFLSVLVTMGGVAFAGTQPGLMQAVLAHPFLSFLAVLAPLLLAQNTFALYFMVLQMWLSGFTTLEGALPMLRASLELQLRGLGR